MLLWAIARLCFLAAFRSGDLLRLCCGCFETHGCFETRCIFTPWASGCFRVAGASAASWHGALSVLERASVLCADRFSELFRRFCLHACT